MGSFHAEVRYYGIPIPVAMQKHMIYCNDGQVKPVVRIGLVCGNLSGYMSIEIVTVSSYSKPSWLNVLLLSSPMRFESTYIHLFGDQVIPWLNYLHLLSF